MNYLKKLGILCLPLTVLVGIFVDGLICFLLWGILGLSILILAILDIKFDYANDVNPVVEEKK